jgi:hypothetical protein
VQVGGPQHLFVATRLRDAGDGGKMNAGAWLHMTYLCTHHVRIAYVAGE